MATKGQGVLQGGIRRIRTWDNPRWLQPTLDAERAKRHGSAAEVGRDPFDFRWSFGLLYSFRHPSLGCRRHISAELFHG
jgi:hypothetical protein